MNLPDAHTADDRQPAPGRALSARLLAYLGDAVYEVRIRQWVIASCGLHDGPLPDDLHRRTVRLARCEFQASALQTLQPFFSEAECEIARRARNLPIPAGRRSRQAVYRQATALEALIGHWFVSDPARLETLWEQLRPLFSQAALE